MRIRGEVVVTLAFAEPFVQAAALVVVGISLMDQVALTAGSEDPYTHSYVDDWMWHQTIFLTSSDAISATDARLGVLASARYILDVRSRRRCDPSDSLVMTVVNAPPTISPAGIGLAMSGRVLLQETSS